MAPNANKFRVLCGAVVFALSPGRVVATKDLGLGRADHRPGEPPIEGIAYVGRGGHGDSHGGRENSENEGGLHFGCLV